MEGEEGLCAHNGCRHAILAASTGMVPDGMRGALAGHASVSCITMGEPGGGGRRGRFQGSTLANGLCAGKARRVDGKDGGSTTRLPCDLPCDWLAGGVPSSLEGRLLGDDKPLTSIITATSQMAQGAARWIGGREKEMSGFGLMVFWCGLGFVVSLQQLPLLRVSVALRGRGVYQ